MSGSYGLEEEEERGQLSLHLQNQLHDYNYSLTVLELWWGVEKVMIMME